MYASFHSSFLKVVRDFALYLLTGSLKKKNSLVLYVSYEVYCIVYCDSVRITHTIFTLKTLCSFVLEASTVLEYSQVHCWTYTCEIFVVTFIVKCFLYCNKQQQNLSLKVSWGKQRNLQTHQSVWEVLCFLELDFKYFQLYSILENWLKLLRNIIWFTSKVLVDTPIYELC